LLKTLQLALSFFTLLPVAPKELASENDFSKVVRYFTIVGLIYAALNFSLSFLTTNPYLLALAIVIGNILLSGGLHFDGLMDCMDGIAASKSTREETLTVIKDSRVGAFGAMAAPIAILIQFVSLSQADIKQAEFLLMIVVCPIISRFIMFLAVKYQVKQEEGESALVTFKKAADNFALIINSSILLIVLFFGAYFLGAKIDFVFWFIVIILGIYCYQFLKDKLMGHNGDSMGAGLVINETIIFFLYAMLKYSP
jgi:adenosylcobinamide-GDP ribazoletransferase